MNKLGGGSSEGLRLLTCQDAAGKGVVMASDKRRCERKTERIKK